MRPSFFFCGVWQKKCTAAGNEEKVWGESLLTAAFVLHCFYPRTVCLGAIDHKPREESQARAHAKV